MNKEILVLNIYKKSKYDDSKYRDTQVGATREGLINYVCIHFKLDKSLLVKDEREDFPYFTDGGFKYTCEDRYWEYDFICIPQKLHP